MTAKTGQGRPSLGLTQVFSSEKAEHSPGWWGGKGAEVWLSPPQLSQWGGGRQQGQAGTASTRALLRCLGRNSQVSKGPKHGTFVVRDAMKVL